MALAWPVAATFCSKRTTPSLGRRLCSHTAQEGNWQSLHRVLTDAPKSLISFSALHSAHVFLSSDFHCVHTYLLCLSLRSVSTGANAARGFMVLHVSHRCCDGSAAWQTGSAQYQIFTALAWPVAATFCSKRTAPSLGRRLCSHTAQEGNWQSLHRVLRDAPKTLISFSALHSAHVFLFSDLHCVHTYISCLTLCSTLGGNAAGGFMVLHVAHF